MERTLAILKPDCIKQNYVGKVLERIEQNGFKIIGLKMIQMTEPVAKGFYAVHKDKPFFSKLIAFMTEGPCVVAVLEKEDAVVAWRKLMGATNPEVADEGTIRRDMAENMSRNIVHGSDSLENAKIEIDYFFSASSLIQTISK